MFRTPPAFCKGPLRGALQLALELIRDLSGSPNDLSSPDGERAWNAWLFLPRMLLHRPPGGARIDTHVLLSRFLAFSRGEWAPLLRQALSQAPPASPPQVEAEHSNDGRRAERAVHLAHLGELSAARQALLSAPLAPEDDDTYQQLTDPSRRPRVPYGALPPELLAWSPDAPVALNRSALLTNLRRARKGLPPGRAVSRPRWPA